MRNQWRFIPTIRLACAAAYLCMASFLFAQDDPVTLRTEAQIKNFYLQREQQAPEQVKKELTTLRARIKKDKLGFTVGYTGASNRSLKVLAGEKNQVPPTEVARIIKLMRERQPDSDDQDQAGALPAKWDSRSKNWVSGVRDQENCGSCWAFAAVAMYESSWLKRYAGSLNTSEQQALDCSDGGSCDGGFSYKVFDWMIDKKKNLKKEAGYPYVAKDKPCPATATNTQFYAKSWKVLRPDGDITKIADVATIKKAIMKYGAVCASLVANSDWNHYTGGVLNGMPSNAANPSSNHAILIVGWNDAKKAFLVKNSWGKDWGLDGYCWVKYNTYNIGRRASVVVANKQ